MLSFIDDENRPLPINTSIIPLCFSLLAATILQFTARQFGLGTLVMDALAGFIIFKVATGRNWARTLYAVLEF